VTTWFGLFAPSRTSVAILDQLHHETVKAIVLPDVRHRLDEQGIGVIGSSPQELASIITYESRFWAKVIMETGVKLFGSREINGVRQHGEPAQRHDWNGLGMTEPSRGRLLCGVMPAIA
jgi:Tripartite tricarboxylate transporter family receptor